MSNKLKVKSLDHMSKNSNKTNFAAHDDDGTLEQQVICLKETVQELLSAIKDMNDLQEIAFNEIEAIALMFMLASEHPEFSIYHGRFYDLMSSIKTTSQVASSNIGAISDEWCDPRKN